jgi:SNF2 family DNA or RNA helicase
VELPRDLTATLRPYQRQGVNWLSFLREHGLNALLADDMGLGKTLQAICLISGRTLVVAPTSVIHSWRDQILRFRPKLSVSLYHGPSRLLSRDSDVTITTYAVLRLDIEKLLENSWDMIVLDEAQTIRNPDSQVARAAYRLEAQFKVSLSGTPVENSLEDLWSQFYFLNRGLLGSRREFEEGVARAVRAADVEASMRLRRRVTPLILRRLKRDVAKELPPKTEVVLACELNGEERTLYEAVLGSSRSELIERLEQGESMFSVLEVLLRLRQACCHPALLPGQSASSSSKVEMLVESLATSIEQEHRALVFSQWTSLLDLVEPHLLSHGISFSRIDGSTLNRAELVEQFQRTDGPQVMLLSLKAGGLGLTLTAADHVYILDPWWNPAVEDQAADRAYRIGQENPVIVHRLVAQDTIEERILELQQRKRGLLAAALGQEGEVSLSREDVLQLLA